MEEPEPDDGLSLLERIWVTLLLMGTVFLVMSCSLITVKMPPPCPPMQEPPK